MPKPLGRFGWLFAPLALWIFLIPVQAQELWSVKDGEIALNLTEAKFLKLDKPAKSVFLSNPGVADIDLQSARYLYIVGRGVGASDLFILGEEDEEMFSTRLTVGIDARRLSTAAQRAVTGGAVSVSTLDGAIFLYGNVSKAEDVAAAEAVVGQLAGEAVVVVNQLQVAAQAQVNLQVRIIEVSRSISEDLGIRLTVNDGNVTNFSAPGTGIEGPFSITLSSRSRNLNLILDALARNGMITVVSEPNLTARSGETATFLAGGRIHYVYGKEDSEYLQLEPVGVELEFTPTVGNNNRIQIVLDTRVRDVDQANSNATVPALTERSATTTVDLASGQSFAIAGMFQANTRQSLASLPGLGKVPVIGALFRSSRFSRGETEMVIVVTPYLVNSTPPDMAPDPRKKVNPVGDGLEQVVTGRLTRPVRINGAGSGVSAANGFYLQ